MALFPTKILVATDGSESAAPAVRAAAEVSAKTDSEIELVYVGEDISAPAAYNDPSSSDTEAAREARELLDDVAKEIEADGGKVLESHIVPSEKPAEEIVKLTREQDVGLVVVGSRGLGRLQYAVQGSVSSIVVREAECPVLVVHGA
ncbi:MAG: universal stress protein [Actinomycetota bacterium]|nr:universal stress protein [Actinomycetota bacterium]